MPGVQVANVEQQDWFAAVATKVLLPRFKAAHKPFVMVFWSRDPDGTQHNEGDSLNSLTPGINGPTSLAGIRNASNDLQALRDSLAALGLGRATGRVLGESLVYDGAPVPAETHVLRSAPAGNGFATILDWQTAGGAPYFDAAGAPGRTIGLAN